MQIPESIYITSPMLTTFPFSFKMCRVAKKKLTVFWENSPPFPQNLQNLPKLLEFTHIRPTCSSLGEALLRPRENSRFWFWMCFKRQQQKTTDCTLTSWKKNICRFFFVQILRFLWKKQKNGGIKKERSKSSITSNLHSFEAAGGIFHIRELHGFGKRDVVSLGGRRGSEKWRLLTARERWSSERMIVLVYIWGFF